MNAKPESANDIDEYVAGFPPDVRKVLEKVRKTIHKAVPGLEEKISYGIPTFTLNGKYVVYMAGNKGHVGLYPAPIDSAGFKKDLAPYASGKGTARFRYGEPMPFDLITRIVKFRAEENRKKERAKAEVKKNGTRK